MAPPAATLTLADDSTTAPWDAAATIDVFANDRASSGALSLVSVTAPAHGTASVSNGHIVYTPASGCFGSDSFGYTVRADDGGATAAPQVSVTVEAQLVPAGTAGYAASASAPGRRWRGRARRCGCWRR